MNGTLLHYSVSPFHDQPKVKWIVGIANSARWPIVLVRQLTFAASLTKLGVGRIQALRTRFKSYFLRCQGSRSWVRTG